MIATEQKEMQHDITNLGIALEIYFTEVGGLNRVQRDKVADLCIRAAQPLLVRHPVQDHIDAAIDIIDGLKHLKTLHDINYTSWDTVSDICKAITKIGYRIDINDIS
jgi:hypothetical protein